MIRIAGHDDVPAVFGSAFREPLHPRHKRTSSIDDFRGALLEFGLYLRRHPVRANHGDLIFRDLRGTLNGRYAFAFQALHLLRIVNQRAQRAHRGADFERALDHFNRALNAEAESVFVSQ